MEVWIQIIICMVIVFGPTLFCIFYIHWNSIKKFIGFMLQNYWFLYVVPLFFIFWSGVITTGTFVIYPIKIVFEILKSIYNSWNKILQVENKTRKILVITGNVKKIVPVTINVITPTLSNLYSDMDDNSLSRVICFILILETPEEQEMSIKFNEYPPKELQEGSKATIHYQEIAQNDFIFVT